MIYSSSSDFSFLLLLCLRVSHWQFYAKVLDLSTGYCKLLCLTNDANWESSRDYVLASCIPLFADFDKFIKSGESCLSRFS